VLQFAKIGQRSKLDLALGLDHLGFSSQGSSSLAVWFVRDRENPEPGQPKGKPVGRNVLGEETNDGFGHDFHDATGFFVRRQIQRRPNRYQ